MSAPSLAAWGILHFATHAVVEDAVHRLVSGVRVELAEA